MPITNIEFLEDRVKIHYHLTKPYGIPDVDNTIEVVYDSIDKLTKLSEADKPYGFENDEEIYIPKVNQTIVFRHGGHMEGSVGPKEEDMDGPYLKKD